MTHSSGPLPADGQPVAAWVPPDAPGVRHVGPALPLRTEPSTDTRGPAPHETPTEAQPARSVPAGEEPQDPRPVDRPGWFERSGLNLLLLAITAVASYWAATGWAGFSEDWMGATGYEAYLVFGLFEGAAGALILLINRARLADDGAAMLWLAVWVIAGLGITGQLLHALKSEHPESAFVYCTASGLAVWLWQIKARRKHRERLKRLGRIADPLPGQGGARWLLFRRSIWRATVVAAWYGISDPNEAIRRSEELYPSGLLPWEKATRKAAERAAGRRWFTRHTKHADVTTAEVTWPVYPQTGATVLQIVSAQANAPAKPQAKPVTVAPKAEAKRPAPQVNGADRPKQPLRTLDKNLQLLRAQFPGKEPSHREVFDALGINSKSTSGDLKKLIRAELANGRESESADDQERSA